LKIAAPVTSRAEAEQVLNAGADELYFGLMLPEWVEEFDDADLWSRRQGKGAHVATLAEAGAIAEVAAAHGKLAALAVNARLTRAQTERVLDTIGCWEAAGGEAVILSDLGILTALNHRGSKLHRQLSLLAGVFNAKSVTLFASLGVCRVILPRELTIAEMAELTSGAPFVEYEALALNQRCPFIDGMCGFHHRQRIPEGVPADFEYKHLPGRPLPVVSSCDPEYEGHGCQLAWRTADGPVQLQLSNDFHRPHCAACQLPLLNKAGVSVLKIAGRGYPVEIIIRAVRFLRDAIDLHEICAEPERVRQLYADTFGTACKSDSCYYLTGVAAED
jgi:collagenase-like PrtC family protease